ncbi:hypothetical protein SELMODRAFT_149815 [Selaginella moellendorffii]|uniref:Uncharacterized protein n=1 Tax=Selaginella moellendorffii TaxID=88036 RepID=D8RTP3_SELML|nr:protein MAINTENANCE OF PSII UNDER HIGH LIGHT 1 [Selaginella moellendorffii]XP_002990869.1 protein MAINTENANCE OF PSII UNDER HIGH LIGHT 1 [Selaginella moellendorffii]EFJ08142.1 hypothetical protein SELMODRAFT_185617 [Selaginella moellendorffii]EFJ24545.1 hypothetical protein SELMODRAFT_149815 [Selaginella moellendorffii]|eukprot:XP_002974323.1 protein MAINTENANCE OF PSII UNDER HIGH LIGHT 1 [Selaginella moellendorffii]
MAASLVGSSSTSTTRSFLGFTPRKQQQRRFSLQIVRAIKAPEECNEEECAPTKEVGSLSMDWKAEENTKVVGTFPPIGKQNRVTGYVEKDSAGQTNVYAVEPPVYVAESAISTGSAGASSQGSENTVAIIAGLGIVTVAATAVILSQESAPPQAGYSGPPLSYYIQKFQPSPALTPVQIEEPPLISGEEEAPPLSQ